MIKIYLLCAWLSFASLVLINFRVLQVSKKIGVPASIKFELKDLLGYSLLVFIPIFNFMSFVVLFKTGLRDKWVIEYIQRRTNMHE